MFRLIHFLISAQENLVEVLTSLKAFGVTRLLCEALKGLKNQRCEAELLCGAITLFRDGPGPRTSPSVHV